MPDPRTLALQTNKVEAEGPDPSPDPKGSEPRPVNVQTPQPTDCPFKDLKS